MQQVRPNEVARQIAAELGIEPVDFVHRARAARWGRADFDQRMAEPDWRDRFAVDVDAAARGRARRAGVPQTFCELSHARALGLMVPELRPLAELYDPATHGGRVLLGATGIGKSTCAALVVRRLAIAAPDMRMLWVGAADLPRARREQPLGYGEADLVDRAMHADFVVMDDLGWEREHGSGAGVVAEVIAARYDARRVTLATSGLTRGDLVATLGDAVVRRITQAGGRPGKMLDLHTREAA